MSRFLTALIATTTAICLAACASPSRSFDGGRAADHNRIGIEAMRRGEHDLATSHFNRALEIAGRQSDRKEEGRALYNLGSIREDAGEPAAALALYERAEESARQALDERGEFTSALNRSRVLLTLGEYEPARDALDNASRLAAALGSRETRAACQKQRARLAHRDGDLLLAIALAREAVRLYDISASSPADLAEFADARLVLGLLLIDRGDTLEATQEFQLATELARQASDPALTAAGLTAVADSLRALGHVEDARIRYFSAFETHRGIPDYRRARDNLTALRELADAEGRIDRLSEYDDLLADLDRAERGAAPGTNQP